MSCQDVCLWGGEYESGEFYAETKPRAAKEHKCCECRAIIPKGEVHVYAKGKNDGMFWDYRVCSACDEIGRVFYCDGPRCFEMLWEDVREQMFPRWNEMVAIDCLARLTTDAAIAKMRAQYAEYLESSHGV